MQNSIIYRSEEYRRHWALLPEIVILLYCGPDEFKGGPDDALTGKDITPPGPLPYADIGNPQSLNKYSYTYNNPLRYIDPDGHDVYNTSLLSKTILKLLF